MRAMRMCFQGLRGCNCRRFSPQSSNPPCTLNPGPAVSLQDFSQPTPPDPVAALGIPDLARIADEIGQRHGAELARVGAEVPVIAEQKNLAGRNGDVEVAAPAGLLPLHPPDMRSRLLGGHDKIALGD